MESFEELLSKRFSLFPTDINNKSHSRNYATELQNDLAHSLEFWRKYVTEAEALQTDPQSLFKIKGEENKKV